MIPKGVLMMLKQLLPALGITIDPVAVEALWNKMSVAIPDFLTKADQKITSIDARLASIEEHQAIILERLDKLEQPVISDEYSAEWERIKEQGTVAVLKANLACDEKAVNNAG